MKRIGLYGVSGIGKSTILKELVLKHPDLLWLEGAKLLLETANIDLITFKKSDDLEKMRYRENAIKQAFKIQAEEKRDVIIDGHFSFPDDANSFKSVFTSMDNAFYKDIIYLQLPPEVILKRQLSDFTRKRNHSIEQIKAWVEYEIQFVNELANKDSHAVYYLKSESLDECINYISTILNK